MKRLSIIIAIVFATSLLISCKRGYEPTIELATDNFELQLPKSLTNVEEYVYYARVSSNGEWEATLELELDGESWCWFQEYYVDAKGNKVQVVTPVQAFDGEEETRKWCKIKGSGTVWVPIRYVTTASERHAVMMLRRTDDVKKQCVMYITQK